MLERREDTLKREHADVSRFYRDTSKGTFVWNGGIRRSWIGSVVGGEETRENVERVNLGRLTESVSCSSRRRCHPAASTSMLPGDKVLFFTKLPSVAQARPIKRQWLVNSSQSGGKPRRDRDHGAILLMNYLSGRNNNRLCLAPLLFWFRGRIFHATIRILSSRRIRIFRTKSDCL